MAMRDRLEMLDVVIHGMSSEICRELINLGLHNLREMKCIRSNTYRSSIINDVYYSAQTACDERSVFYRYMNGVIPAVDRRYRNSLLVAVGKLSGGEITGLTPSVLHTQLSKGTDWPEGGNGKVRAVLWTPNPSSKSWTLRMVLPDKPLVSRYLRRIMSVDTFIRYGLNIRLIRNNEQQYISTLTLEISPSRSFAGFCVPLAILPTLRPRLMELYRLCYEVVTRAEVARTESIPEEYTGAEGGSDGND